MGAKCCAGQEAKDNGADASAMRPKNLPTDEEMVKGTAAPAATAQQAGSGRVEFQVVVSKAQGGPRLGVDVDLSDGVALVIDKVNDGLIGEWNKNNPGKEVLKDDRVINVNGVTGNAQELAEVCKRDDSLQMVIERLVD